MPVTVLVTLLALVTLALVTLLALLSDLLAALLALYCVEHKKSVIYQQ